MNEAETRAEHIDPALKAAGWGWSRAAWCGASCDRPRPSATQPRLTVARSQLLPLDGMWEHLHMNDLYNAITSDPQRRSGRPCVRDLRISVGDVLGWLADGQTPAQIVAEYPELRPEDIRACLAYAAARESHEVRLAAAA